MAAVPRPAGVRYIGLVLNRRGLDRAVAAGVDEINVVVVASDTFSAAQPGDRPRTRRSRLRHGSAPRPATRASGSTMTVATAFGCPFEGEVRPARVAEVAASASRPGRTRSRSPTRSASPFRVTSARWPARCAAPHRRAAALPLPQHPQHRLRQRPRRGRGGRRPPSTRAAAGSAAARSRPPRPATSPPRTCSTPSAAAASAPGSTWTGCSLRRPTWRSGSATPTRRCSAGPGCSPRYARPW